MCMWAGGSCEGQGGFGPFLERPERESDAGRWDWCPTHRRNLEMRLVGGVERTLGKSRSLGPSLPELPVYLQVARR